MTTVTFYYLVLLGLIATSYSQQQSQNRQAYNPHILEDARVHPTSDGTFGFLYRTQDGISHAAKGVPGGAVQGRFTYTDPTGLKVNFNYNAGAQALKAPQQEQVQQTYQQPKYSQNQYQPSYEAAYEPQPKYQAPKYPPKPRSRYVQYQQPEASYEQPRYESAPRRETYSAPIQDSYSQNYLNDNYEQQYYQ